MRDRKCGYGVATVRWLLKMIALFCKKDLSKRVYSAKEREKLGERQREWEIESGGMSWLRLVGSLKL